MIGCKFEVVTHDENFTHVRAKISENPQKGQLSIFIMYDNITHMLSIGIAEHDPSVIDWHLAPTKLIFTLSMSTYDYTDNLMDSIAQIAYHHKQMMIPHKQMMI